MLSVDYFQDRLSKIIDLIEQLVLLESPSTDKQAVDRLVDFVEAEAAKRGAHNTRFSQAKTGDHLAATWGEGEGGVLLLTHLDTVHAIGTLEKMPFEREGRRLLGPGVLDMKASVALSLAVVESLSSQAKLPDHRITLLCTSDEEIGSGTSRDLIVTTAQTHQLVLCLEPGLADGSLKTRRKGIGLFKLKTKGIPSHAGANPGDGVNAIIEMAHQLGRISQMNENSIGVTLNAGKISGGSRSNVVPERCLAEIDVRIPSEEAGQWVEEQLNNLEPLLTGAAVEISGGWNRPPMPRTSAIGQAFARAELAASELGLEIGEGETGGGSDANFVAPLGIPLIDGLGPLGAGAHSNEEYVWIDSLPRRAALLAAMIYHPL